MTNPSSSKNKSMSNSRQGILDRLRSRIVDQQRLPDLGGDGSIGEAAIKFSDPVQQFKDAVELVGGSVEEAPNIRELKQRLSGDMVFSMARTVCSLLGDEFPGTIDLNTVDAPRDIEHVDYTIVKAEFGVAENGALWITDQGIKHRVVLFITQHLAIVVDRNSIVNNMHEGYKRIASPNPGFGVFVAGPSKTADIEQSLVLGAHGCRSLSVFVVG